MSTFQTQQKTMKIAKGFVTYLPNKDRFCNTIASVALVHTSAQSD